MLQLVIVFAALDYVFAFDVQEVADFFHVALNFEHGALVCRVVGPHGVGERVVAGTVDVVAQFNQQFFAFFLKVIYAILHALVELVDFLKLILQLAEHIAVRQILFKGALEFFSQLLLLDLGLTASPFVVLYLDPALRVVPLKLPETVAEFVDCGVLLGDLNRDIPFEGFNVAEVGVEDFAFASEAVDFHFHGPVVYFEFLN
jgi:hypothetical protein